MFVKVLALVTAISGAGLSAAQAMPMAAAPQGVTAPVVQVDYACGRGYHLNRWGECRPNWGPPPRREWRGEYGRRYYRPAPPRYYGWDHRAPPPWAGPRW